MVKKRTGRDLEAFRGKHAKRGDSAATHAEIQQLIAPIKVSYVDPSALTAAPRNARLHSERQVAQIAASINEFGFVVPIVTDEQGTVLAGHGRLAAARQLGLPKVPAVEIGHLNDEQKRAFRLADNRLAELSGWDDDVLKLELAELTALDLTFNFEITGFDTVDIDRLLEGRSPTNADPADILPPVPDSAAISRLGDVWQLGPHRLLCADACDPQSYKILLGGEAAQMVFTDPPYNVPIRGHASTRKFHREFPMASGEMTPLEFKAFLEQAFHLMANASQDGAIHFVCMDWRHVPELLAAATPVYDMPKQLAVWVKDNAGMGTFYRSQHELIFVFKIGTAPHINNFGLGERGRYRTNVWQYPGATSKGKNPNGLLAAHPTVKPVTMVADAIKDCSRRGSIILDPFGGSGTTLIAAERTRRAARLIELDPLYADLIVTRWQTFTGQRAFAEQSGESFDEIARTRAGG